MILKPALYLYRGISQLHVRTFSGSSAAINWWPRMCTPLLHRQIDAACMVVWVLPILVHCAAQVRADPFLLHFEVWFGTLEKPSQWIQGCSSEAACCKTIVAKHITLPVVHDRCGGSVPGYIDHLPSVLLTGIKTVPNVEAGSVSVKGHIWRPASVARSDLADSTHPHYRTYADVAAGRLSSTERGAEHMYWRESSWIGPIWSLGRIPRRWCWRRVSPWIS